ncbi:hypothetical protein SAMN04488573_103591, partial [Bacillus sp. 5mfcol3.1]
DDVEKIAKTVETVTKVISMLEAGPNQGDTYIMARPRSVSIPLVTSLLTNS